MHTTTPLKTIVIDPDPRFHESFAYYFSTYPEYGLCGIYRSVEEALEDYPSKKPDFVLSEVHLPLYLLITIRNIHYYLLSKSLSELG